jgi:RNA polymerase sigma factor (sigma-70 family)
VNEPRSGAPRPAPDDPAPHAAGPAWAARLVGACVRLKGAPGEAGEHPAWPDAWLLLSTGLHRYLRLHASRMASVADDDLRDLASEKTLGLLARIVSGAWDVEGRTGAEVAAYLSTAARNTLVDWLRRENMLVRTGDDQADEERDEGMRETGTSDAAGDTDRGVQNREFAEALEGCVGGLEPRARRAWFFRTFYDMSSREIAAHPDVAVRVGHLDVILFRSRQALRRCMTRKGHSLETVPPGAFVELWTRLRGETPTGEDH